MLKKIVLSSIFVLSCFSSEVKIDKTFCDSFDKKADMYFERKCQNGNLSMLEIRNVYVNMNNKFSYLYGNLDQRFLYEIGISRKDWGTLAVSYEKFACGLSLDDKRELYKFYYGLFYEFWRFDYLDENQKEIKIYNDLIHDFNDEEVFTSENFLKFFSSNFNYRNNINLYTYNRFVKMIADEDFVKAKMFIKGNHDFDFIDRVCK